jgi:hypothetical protein
MTGFGSAEEAWCFINGMPLWSCALAVHTDQCAAVKDRQLLKQGKADCQMFNKRCSAVMDTDLKARLFFVTLNYKKFGIIETPQT